MSRAKRRRREEHETEVFSFSNADVPSQSAVANIYEASQDGRRVRHASTRYTAPALPPRFPHLQFSPEDLPWTRELHDTLDLDLDSDVPAAEPYVEAPAAESSPEAPAAESSPEAPAAAKPPRQNKTLGEKSFATLVHDQVLLDWAKERDYFLDELLRLDGWAGERRQSCPMCANDHDATPEFRCMDCSGHTVVCKACCLTSHQNQPFHRVKQWNGRFFESVTLKDIGLVIQLGHLRGEYCSAPSAAPRSFVVIHTNGLHPVNVQYCQCDRQKAAGTKLQQLLRYELYPATLEEPTTCCTFRGLEHFHLLTLQSKVTAYDYYLTLTKLTDRAGIRQRYDRLKPFLRMVREWRHMQLLKNHGRGHEPGGVNATKPGELCTRCPACPLPGFNIPENWESVSEDLRFIYTTFVAIDANFRLKRRAISSEARDPTLSPGWGFFVEGSEYREHILKYADQKDISTCTGFAAMMNANKSFKGYATSGCVMAIDARHGFVFPNGVGDLQKGERQCNVDFVAMSALQHIARGLRLVLSYDIMCQWLRFLLQRIAELPQHLRIELPEGEVRYAIPKYHFNAHKEEGHNQYSLNFQPGMCRTDCEEVERGWSRFDPVAGSTQEMGPGSREETLNDHMEFNNVEKYLTMGPSLDKRERTATAGFVKFDRLHETFVADLQPSHVAEWTKTVLAYEQDRSQPDPYYWKSTGMSESEIRIQLLREEEADANRGNVPLHEVTPAAMLSALLDLEDQQRRFRAKYPPATSGNPVNTAEVIAKRASLRHRITSIRNVQAIYMPCVPMKLARHRQSLVAASASTASNGPSTSSRPRSQADADVVDLPEHQPLFLPSSLGQAERDGCAGGITDMECKLRDGQLADSLDKLRVHLHIRSRLVSYRDRHVRHQGPSTRARTRIDQNESKITALKAKYRAARAAKVALVGPGTWEQRYKPLEDADVTAIRGDDAISGVGMSEGKYVLSWIWMGADGGDANGIRGLHDALRVEFLKSRARKERYREESLCVQAEKIRVGAALEKNALRWDEREGRAARLKKCPIVAGGAAAYAAERAATERALSHRFSTLWWRAPRGLAVITDEDEGAEATGERAARGTVPDEDLHFADAADDSDDDLSGADSDDES
ncbi:CxC2 domain-containing protein [Phanerochaete sordida]|uniref:CxC2 domain-containing protein n=1 Tax=Phanerochaete sordida TaxID=48140 RepID=A0A9P3GT24_9APHY|nr:CxC2 domain-containing protein [Phanerochaete sordida]